jgi:hypothetical protein
MPTCKRCNNEKPDAEMLHRRGKPSKVCLECFGKAMAKGVDAVDRSAKKAKGGRKTGKEAPPEHEGGG